MTEIKIGDCVRIARITQNLWAREFEDVLGNVGYVSEVRLEKGYEDFDGQNDFGPPYYRVRFLNQDVDHHNHTWFDSNEVEKIG